MTHDVQTLLARIRELEARNSELERLVTIDPLTGLHNRMGFLAVLVGGEGSTGEALLARADELLVHEAKPADRVSGCWRIDDA